MQYFPSIESMYGIQIWNYYGNNWKCLLSGTKLFVKINYL